MANVLLVDDNEDLLDALSTFLKMKNHTVQCVSSHKEAWNILSIYSPDVILIDVRIKGDDGRELCKEIKEKHKTNIPIILLSASPALLHNYEECKADAIIEKPLNLESVIEKINGVVNKYKGASA